jgi:NitT/TauT family transport system substrate-binding protein
MSRIKYRGFILAALAFVLVLGPVSALSAEKPKKVVIGVTGVGMTEVPLWIAQEKGFFKQEGLDVEVTTLRGNTTTVQALLAGQIQASWGGASAPISAIAGGARDVAIVAQTIGTMAYLLVSTKPIKNPSELNGKMYATDQPGGSGETATRICIKAAGGDPKSAIMRAVGSSADRLAALQSGSVYACALSASVYAAAVAAGAKLHVIVDLSETDIEYPHTTIFVSKKYASNNRDAVLGMLKGYMRGARYFEKNKEESIKIASAHLNNPKREVLEAQWKYTATHTFEKVPYMTQKAFELVIDELAKENPKVASLKMGDVFDASYLNELFGNGIFTRRAMEANQ